MFPYWVAQWPKCWPLHSLQHTRTQSALVVLDHFSVFHFGIYFKLIHFPRTILFTEWNIYCIYLWLIKVRLLCSWKSSENIVEADGKRRFITIHMYVDRFLPIILWFLWNSNGGKSNAKRKRRLLLSLCIGWRMDWSAQSSAVHNVDWCERITSVFLLLRQTDR